MNRQLVISDIHGKYELFNQLIDEVWDKENEELIILGDMVDRGEDSLKVLQKVMELKKNHQNVYVTKGNHEQLFKMWLEHPELEKNIYFKAGGLETVFSFLKHRLDLMKEKDKELMRYNMFKQAEAIKEDYPEIIQFISELPLYIEREHTIFVHAGVDLSKDDWKESDENDLLWIREEFHNGVNKTKKSIVFGHTPVKYFKHTTHVVGNIWNNYKERLYGIDGGAFETNKLNAVRVNKGEVTDVFHTGGALKSIIHHKLVEKSYVVNYQVSSSIELNLGTFSSKEEAELFVEKEKIRKQHLKQSEKDEFSKCLSIVEKIHYLK